MKIKKSIFADRKKQVMKVLGGQSLTSHSVADVLSVSERTARIWLKSLHVDGKVFISTWKEGPSGIGQKAPSYKRRTTSLQVDATKWWLL